MQGLKPENPISYGHAMSFLMHVVAHNSHYVVFYTTLPYLFTHSFQPMLLKNAYFTHRVRFRIPTRILNVFYLLELSFFYEPKFVNN